MAIPRVKSRVQLQSKLRQRAKHNKKQTQKANPEQISNIAHNLNSPESTPQKGMSHPTKVRIGMYPLKSPAYTFSVESDDPIYEDYSSSIEQAASPCFSKKRVSSTEEVKVSGACNSELHAVVGAADACAIEDTEDECDPGDSLIILAPVCAQQGEGLNTKFERAVDEILDSLPIKVGAMELQPLQATKVVESSDPLQAPLSISDFEDLSLTLIQEQQQAEVVEEAPATAPWQQKLVCLFAGRKKSPDVQTHKKRNDSGASSWIVFEDSVSQVSEDSVRKKVPEALATRDDNSENTSPSPVPGAPVPQAPKSNKQKETEDAQARKERNNSSTLLHPVRDEPVSQASKINTQSKTHHARVQKELNISGTPPIHINGQPVFQNGLFDEHYGCTRYDSPLYPNREPAPQLSKHNSAQPYKPPQPPQCPPLPLRRVIPPVRVKKAELPSEQARFHIPVQALKHEDAGYAVIEPDEFEPDIVQRGFLSPNSINSPNLTAPSELEHHRNNFASNLLDRNGDTWAVWNERNAEHPDEMVFAKRTRSNSELSKKGGVRRARAGTVKGFLEVIGDQYPYNQGLCW
jgi:hypothetical protein